MSRQSVQVPTTGPMRAHLLKPILSWRFHLESVDDVGNPFHSSCGVHGWPSLHLVVQDTAERDAAVADLGHEFA